MSTIIQHSDIQKGDTIRVEWPHYDAEYTCTGDAAKQLGAEWYTEVEAQLTRRDRKQTIHLLNRPKPPLPKEAGTIIYSQMPVEGAITPLILLQDDCWWYLNGDSFYHANSVANHPWKLAKVVTA